MNAVFCVKERLANGGVSGISVGSSAQRLYTVHAAFRGLVGGGRRCELLLVTLNRPGFGGLPSWGWGGSSVRCLAGHTRQFPSLRTSWGQGPYRKL